MAEEQLARHTLQVEAEEEVAALAASGRYQLLTVAHIAATATAESHLAAAVADRDRLQEQLSQLEQQLHEQMAEKSRPALLSDHPHHTCLHNLLAYIVSRCQAPATPARAPGSVGGSFDTPTSCRCPPLHGRFWGQGYGFGQCTFPALLRNHVCSNQRAPQPWDARLLDSHQVWQLHARHQF